MDWNEQTNETINPEESANRIGTATKKPTRTHGTALEPHWNHNEAKQQQEPLDLE